MAHVPDYVRTAAARHPAGILIAEYPLARRKLIHLTLDPRDDTQAEHRDLLEAIAWLHERGLATLVLVAGRRRRPQVYWWGDLAALDSSDRHRIG